MPSKDPVVQRQRSVEASIKSHFIIYAKRWYPLSHVVIIPGTFWRLLPYDLYILHGGIMRAVELKIDENEVMAHQYQALMEVAANKGYAFVVRWINPSKRFIVENFTTGGAEIFRGEPSERQLLGTSVKDPDDFPATKVAAFKQVIDYIYSFTVTPLEEQVQASVKRMWDEKLKKKLERM